MSSSDWRGPGPRVLAAQVRVLYEKAPFSIGATLGVGAVVLSLLLEVVPTALLWSWYAALVVLSGLRGYGWLRCRARSNEATAGSWVSPVFVLALTLALGVAWGGAGVLFFTPESLVHQMLLVFAIGGMCTGATVSLGSYGPAFLAFLLPAAIPMTSRLFVEGDRLHIGMGAMAALYTLAVAIMGWTAARRFEEMVRLRFQNEDMASILAHRAEAALARFRALLKQADECILIASCDTLEVADANDAAAHLLAPGRERVIGEPLSSLTVEADGPLDWKALVERVETEGPRVVEAAVKADADQVRQVELRLSIHTFDDESYLLVVALDVTAGLRMKEQLVQTSLMASVGTLAAGVAHEINNPLTYIVTNLEYLTQEVSELDTLPDPKREGFITALDECMDGTRRIRAIVRDLGALSRDPGEGLVPVDVNEVVESCLNVASSEVTHRARVVRDLLPSLVPALGDPTRLAQVLVNLIVNAAQAIPPDGKGNHTVTLRTRFDPLRNRVRIEVEDTGVGIPEVARSRVFDPFFTTREVGSGAGLGLSICRSIVASFGGSLTFETKEHVGTRFTVELRPAGDASLAGVEEGARVTVGSLPGTDAADQASTASAPRAEGGTILVVDDDPMVAEGISRALRSFEVEVTHGGQQALEILRARGFRLVLCDLMMPGLSGMEVYSRVKRELPSQADRFVFLTGGAFTKEARDFLKGVSNHSIQKPFEIKALRDFAQKWLSEHD